MSKGKPGFMLYHEKAPLFTELPDEDAGKLIKSAFLYSETGETPHFDGVLAYGWASLRRAIDADSTRYYDDLSKKAEAGRKGGLAKASNAKQCLALLSGAISSSQHNTTQSIPTQSIPTQSSKFISVPLSGERVSDKETDFSVFWKAYPRKEAKKAAERAFSKVSAPLETLLSALECQKQSVQWKKDGGQYIPLASTWLNGRRWEDEQPAPRELVTPGWDFSEPVDYSKRRGGADDNG